MFVENPAFKRPTCLLVRSSSSTMIHKYFNISVIFSAAILLMECTWRCVPFEAIIFFRPKRKQTKQWIDVTSNNINSSCGFLHVLNITRHFSSKTRTRIFYHRSAATYPCKIPISFIWYEVSIRNIEGNKIAKTSITRKH